MKLSNNERKLFELERKEYKTLLDDISRPRKIDRKGLTITCIGNSGGRDSILHGHPSGGMMIHFGGRCIVVDPGENCLSYLNESGFDPYQITDVIASHSHNDHVGDLTSIISSALQLNLVPNEDTNILVSPSLIDYENADNTRYGFTLPTYAWEGNVRMLYWQDTQVTRYDGEMVQSQKTASIGEDIKIISVEGRHSKLPVSGYVFNTPLGKLAYTGDTEFFPELAELYKGSDVLWMNLNTLGLDSSIDTDTYVAEEASCVKNHLGYVGVCKLIEMVQPKTAIISHFGSQLLPKVGEIQTLLQKRFDKEAINIFCVLTGDEICFEESLDEDPGLGSFCE